MKMVKTAVLVSGGGVNLQSLLDARMFGEIPQCDIAAVISTNPEAYALKRAQMAGIPTSVVERELFPSQTVFCFALLDKLRDMDIQLVVLAGFDGKLTAPIFKHYSGRIINTYPALMPAFTSDGLSDLEIQAAALRAGVKITGATSYFVGEENWHGPIILQKAVAVNDRDTPVTLQRRVLEEGENIILPRTVSLYCEGRLKTENGIVRVLDNSGGGEKNQPRTTK